MMKNRNSEAMFGIRKGIALYFNDFIEKDIIKEIIRQILEITGAKFTSKRAQGEPKIRLIRGGWEKVFDNTFKNSTFDDGANILMLTDATKETLQTTQISMTLWNPDQYKTTSLILVHCMADISWETIISFIQTTNRLLHLQFVSAGYDVVHNAFLYPGSAAYSLKFLQNIRYANSEWTEWSDLIFFANSGICGPNVIQFLSNQLWLPVESRVNQCGFHYVRLETGVILDLLDCKDGSLLEPEKDVLLCRLSKLYQALSPITISLRKPMFLRENEWAAWQKRYLV